MIVLLRWHVNYFTNGIVYPYYYEIKTYKKQNDSIYTANLTVDKDANLGGYKTVENGKVINYPLDNVIEIKKYLRGKYKQ